MKATHNRKINILFSFLLLSALVIQTFSFSLSFYDGLVDGGMIQNILNYVYIFRDICLFSSIGIMLLYRTFPKDSIALLALVFAMLLYTYVVNPGNLTYFQKVQTTFFLCIDVYLIIRSGLINLESFKKVLRIFCYGLSLLAIHIFITKQSTLLFIEQYMDYSNAVSIVSALLLYFGLNEGRKVDLVLGLITYVILFVAGGRGSFITLTLLIVGLVWLKFKSKKLIYIALFLGLVLLVALDVITDLIVSVSSTIEFNSRTIESLLSNNLLRSNDRYELYSYLFDKIAGDFFIGGGICADRYYLDIGHLTDNGYYAHNIFIEFLVDFGAFGLFLFGFILYQIYNFIKKYRNQQNICGFVMVYIVVSFIQLFLSRSWLTEPNFFVLLGLLITYNKANSEYEAIG